MKPKSPIRRFDVFAEYNRQKAMAEDGLPSDEAEGYGLWVAKVVASRRFGGKVGPQPPKSGGKDVDKDEQEEPKERPKWHTLDGEPQTDELFEKEIINRMGREFYYDVFVPAIEEAMRGGRSYTSFRDSIRKDWKP